jgi:HTH-type transcriptional regulator / antitoxin HigA
MEAMTILNTTLQTHWAPIAAIFSLRNEDEYDVAVARLNALVDEIGVDQDHPLYTLLDALGSLVHAYEQEHYPIPSTTGPEVLEYLMDEHDLTATDLSEIGSPEDIGRILAGDQEMSIPQVRALADRFHVSPAAFI